MPLQTQSPLQSPADQPTVTQPGRTVSREYHEGVASMLEKRIQTLAARLDMVETAGQMVCEALKFHEGDTYESMMRRLVSPIIQLSMMVSDRPTMREVDRAASALSVPLGMITDVKSVCPACGWRGAVGDCMPDVDGDGGLGCPTCSTVVITAGDRPAIPAVDLVDATALVETGEIKRVIAEASRAARMETLKEMESKISELYGDGLRNPDSERQAGWQTGVLDCQGILGHEIAKRNQNEKI